MTESLISSGANAGMHWKSVLDKPISRLNGLSIRKIANIINNSLMLVDNPDSLNYNTSLRLHRLLTKGLDSTERMNLSSLLQEYASEDEELRRRLIEMQRFKRSRAEEFLENGRYMLNTEDDVAAEIKSRIMYRAGMANARFAETGKSDNLRIEEIADKYSRKKTELGAKGISLDNALHNGLHRLCKDTRVYTRHVTDFMAKYTEIQTGGINLPQLDAMVNRNGNIQLAEAANKYISPEEKKGEWGDLLGHVNEMALARGK